MAKTNFAALTDEQLTVWQRRVWRAARHRMFINKFVGTDENAMIHRITELTKSDKGARAVLTLVTDLQGDGVAGDRFLEGNEEAMLSSDQVIRIDQLRHAVRSKGRMADQRSVVRFRENANNGLSYWLADRHDQMAFLTLSGVSFALNTDGSPRSASDLPLLDYADDVTAPSANRHYRWDGTNGDFVTPDTGNIAAADTPSYEMFIRARALLDNNFIRPLRTVDGVEWFNVFMTPDAIAELKMDENFMKAWREAQPRSPDHPMFKGTNVIYIDGFAIHSYKHVFNTRGMTAGNKWGGSGTQEGCRVLFCGAQALGMADIGAPRWVEKPFDYDNQPGISLGKISGLLKPKFFSIYNQSVEDYGVTCVDVAV